MTNKGNLEQRKRVTDVMERVISGEIAEKFPSIKPPNLKTRDPEELKKELQDFFRNSKIQEHTEDPAAQATTKYIEERLRQLYTSTQELSRLTQNTKKLESQKPEDLTRQKIAEQDKHIDGNLDILTSLGANRLGQEKYEKLKTILNKKLATRSEPGINDREEIPEAHQNL